MTRDLTPTVPVRQLTQADIRRMELEQRRGRTREAIIAGSALLAGIALGVLFGWRHH